jgi:hypothetical protein
MFSKGFNLNLVILKDSTDQKKWQRHQTRLPVESTPRFEQKVSQRLCSQYATFSPNIGHISTPIMSSRELTMIPCLIQVLPGFDL